MSLGFAVEKANNAIEVAKNNFLFFQFLVQEELFCGRLHVGFLSFSGVVC